MPQAMKPSEIDQLVNILTKQAQFFPDGPDMFFKDLLAKATLPPDWIALWANIGRNSPPVEARRLINWAINQEVNQANSSFTTLGSLLKPLLPAVGFDTASYIAAMISHYQLYRNNDLLQKLEMAYQIPRVAESSLEGPIDFGPDISWRGPDEGVLEPQGWFRPVPDLIDLGFLKRAIEQAASVCRIEIQEKGRGTGFLIASDKLLTNYHVLKDDPGDDLEANARAAVLRFGVFTKDDGNEATGQVFKLATDKSPILKMSPKEKLDYVLLRVADSIASGKDIKPAICEPQVPALRQGLHILQHPEGEAMKISMSTNGITDIYKENGLIQYVTQAKGGSSGSPCFNDDWKVVALHHAQRSRVFGSIREGILFSAIFEEIKPYLNV